MCVCDQTHPQLRGVSTAEDNSLMTAPSEHSLLQAIASSNCTQFVPLNNMSAVYCN